MKGRRRAVSVLVALGWAGAAFGQHGDRGGDWQSYAADRASSKYSPLDQIDRSNVGRLEIAWRWESVDYAARDESSDLRVMNIFETTPVAIDGRTLGPVDLLSELNRMAALHGVGRVDLVEARAVGMKCRGVYETPGGTVLYRAHRGVEEITLDREVMLERDRMSPKIAQLIYNGFWYSPELDFLRAAVLASQEHVTGTTRMRL